MGFWCASCSIQKELADNRILSHGPEAETRSRLQRKLEQRKQAKKDEVSAQLRKQGVETYDRVVVSPSLLALAEEYGSYSLTEDIDAALQPKRESADERKKVSNVRSSGFVFVFAWVEPVRVCDTLTALCCATLA
jgi:hypothetical protein